jgi:ABC-type amino acid transport substrate-binding protein
VGPLFERQSYAVALREGSTLREAVNRALLRLREDGTYTTIYQRWFGDDEM